MSHPAQTSTGVITRAQLSARGWTENDVRRAVRRRELVRVQPQVFVTHTGPLTDGQRSWAALLWAQPAALCDSSLFGAAPGEPVHLAVDQTRRLEPPPGVVLHRVRGLPAMVRPGSSPPRLAIEHDAFLRADRAHTEQDTVAILAEAVGHRGTTVRAMRRALEKHPTVRRRSLIVGLLDDLEGGTESVLEHGFLTRVERPHRLPTPVRQALRISPATGRVERRDLDYPEWGLVIELDGRLNHASWRAGARDAERDLVDTASGHTVLRLRWHQVMEHPCHAAGLLAAAFRARGWSGTLAICPTCT